VFENPSNYGITKIIGHSRTVLDNSYTYEVSVGLTQKEAASLKKKNKKLLSGLNKYPKRMNYFREHMLVMSR